MATDPSRETNFRVPVTHALDVITVLDAHGQIRYASPSIEQTLGYRVAEMVGRSVFDLIPPEDVPELREAFARVLRAPGATETAELRYRRKDGHWVFMESRAKNLLDDPQLGGILVSSRDVTQRVEAERELAQLRDHLQDQVEARTADLQFANARLRQEVEERRRAQAEQQQAEETLRQQEQHFRLLFENNPLPMWVYDLETFAFLEVNDAAVACYGYSREEFLGMRITDIRPPEDVRVLIENLRSPRTALQQQTSWRHTRKDGSVIDVEITSHTIDGRGRRSALVVALDVTERTRAQAALQESEALFRSVVTNAPMITFALDPEGVFTLSEGRGLARLGLEPGEVVGQSVFDLYADAPDTLEAIRAGLDGNVVRWTASTEGASLDVQSAPMYDEHGQVTSLISVATDVTERLEAHRVAVESQQRLDFLYRTMSALLTDALDQPKSLRGLAEAVVPTLADWCTIHVLGPDDTVERVVLTSADPSKASHSTIDQQISPITLDAKVGPGRVLRTGEVEFYPEVPDQVLAELAQDEEHLRLLQDQGFTSALIVPLVARGRILGVLTLASAESGRRYGPEDLALAKDLAFRAGLVIDSARLFEAARHTNAELEQRVLERTAELEAANQELESFSYSVSHDLRSPLRAIDGFTRILAERHAGELDAKALDYLQRVRQNALRMDALIGDLLQFSRLGRKEMQKQTVRPADLVRQVLEEMGPLPEDREVAIEIGDLPACEADALLLRQVYANLIGNALKFSQYRSPAVVRVGATQRNGIPVYFVSDNGTGFDMKYADKLFGVFQRLHRAEDYEGTGVGLAIVQRIVQRHGGKVWAEAAPDEGATFFFTLQPEGT